MLIQTRINEQLQFVQKSFINVFLFSNTIERTSGVGPNCFYQCILFQIQLKGQQELGPGCFYQVFCFSNTTERTAELGPNINETLLYVSVIIMFAFTSIESTIVYQHCDDKRSQQLRVVILSVNSLFEFS